jgi:hypothetical protein
MNGRLSVTIVGALAAFIGAGCLGSAPPPTSGVTSDAQPELRAFGVDRVTVTEVNDGRKVTFIAKDGASLGAALVSTDAATPHVARVTWNVATYDLSWTDGSLDVKEDGRDVASATPAGPAALDATSGQFFKDHIDPIMVGGLVAREAGVAAPWLPSPSGLAAVPRLAPRDDMLMLTVECISGSCSAWDYGTARDCATGSAYRGCNGLSLNGCAESSSSCNCGWFSCSCTSTFCGSY